MSADFSFYEQHRAWKRISDLEPTFCDWWHQRGLTNPDFLEALKDKRRHLNESLSDAYEAYAWRCTEEIVKDWQAPTSECPYFITEDTHEK